MKKKISPSLLGIIISAIALVITFISMIINENSAIIFYCAIALLANNIIIHISQKKKEKAGK